MSFRTGLLLSFVAGFCDTATFVGAHGIFSAHVTGNFVLFAVSVVQGAEEVDFLKLLLFIPFLVSILLVARLSRTSLHRKLESSMLVLAGLLLFASGVGFAAGIPLSRGLWNEANFLLSLPVVAMGIQNAVYKILYPTEPMTTVMTGNVIQAALETVGYGVTPTSGLARKNRIRSTLRLVFGFASGCLAGAWAVHRWALAALIIPALLLVSLGALHHFTENSRS